MIYRFCAFWFAACVAIPALAQYSGPLPPPAPKEPNLCQEKFIEHSPQAAQIEKETRFCSSKKISWSWFSLNRVSWGNYFECFDRYVKVQKSRPNFYKECADPRLNNHFRSDSIIDCLKKVKSFGDQKEGYLCFDPLKSQQILDSKFDRCLENIEALKAPVFSKTRTCIERGEREKFSCAVEIKDIFGEEKSLHYCQEYSTQSRVEKNELIPCVEELREKSVSDAFAVGLCSEWEYEKALECVRENNEKYDSQTLAEKCRKEKFREAARNRNFGACVEKARADKVSEQNSLDLCAQDDRLIDMFAFDTGFEACKTKVMQKHGFAPNNAYASCADENVRREIGNPEFMICFEKGLSATALDYFSHRARELEEKGGFFDFWNKKDTNPYYYVIENCFEDKTTSRRFNNNPYLKLVQDINIHSNTLFKKERTLLGGLSALRFDRERKKLFLLSDDKGQYGSPRVYVYKYDYTNDRLALTEDSLIKFIKGEGKDKTKTDFSWQMDPEGMDFDAAGNIILSSETGSNAISSPLSIFSISGEELGSIPVGEDFVPAPHSYSKGMSHNKGLESLSLDPSKSFLFVANEGPLIQDEMLAKSERDCRGGYCGYKTKQEVVRIAKFAQEEGAFKQKESYFYRLEAERDNGVSEILALDANNLLVLERAYDSGKRKITSRIFHVSLSSASPIKENEEETSILPEDHGNEQEQHGVIVINGDNNPRDFNYYRASYPEQNGAYGHPRSVVFRNNGRGGGYGVITGGSNQYEQRDRRDISRNTLKKTLIIDLDDILPAMAPGFRRLDNFEGLAFGPTLPNGSPTLALIADNNFSLGQRSLMLIFELNEQALKRISQ